MEEFYYLLSSGARIDKSSQKKDSSTPRFGFTVKSRQNKTEDATPRNDMEQSEGLEGHEASRDRTGKRDMTDEKRRQVHKEEIAAFRRSMCIRVSNKHDPDLPDPISKFEEIRAPKWWNKGNAFNGVMEAIARNIEQGQWKEPTPIQMQSIPTLLDRRDIIGAAPTGSGKSGAFIIPTLLLSSAPHHIFYGIELTSKSSKKSKKNKKKEKIESGKSNRSGEVRALVLAPSRELAVQLHGEIDRLGMGKQGGTSTVLLSKTNAAQAISGELGGKNGVDVMVSTPMRLVDAIEKGLRLGGVRIVILDEADRLLDSSDGHAAPSPGSEKEAEYNGEPTSGASHSQTFLSQMDIILSSIPKTSVRGLFSATVTQSVKTLSENILRNPVDLKIAAPGSYGGANTDIDQELMFVGREEGKLLAIRQIHRRGQLKPPVIIFVQSKDRAQALFGELLYDGLRVGVLHAERSQAARDATVAKFRAGKIWVLICTDLVARGVDFPDVNMVINYDLPTSGVSYVHRIGRTGRAGRKGKAVTLFTESDFQNIRSIANVMKQSGCHVADWMLQLNKRKMPKAPRRAGIDTTPAYDKRKRKRKQQIIEQQKKKRKEANN